MSEKDVFAALSEPWAKIKVLEAERDAAVKRAEEAERKLNGKLSDMFAEMKSRMDTARAEAAGLRQQCERLTSELADANHWRERHCRESIEHAKQSQKNWQEAHSLRGERERLVEAATDLLEIWDEGPEGTPEDVIFAAAVEHLRNAVTRSALSEPAAASEEVRHPVMTYEPVPEGKLRAIAVDGGEASQDQVEQMARELLLARAAQPAATVPPSAHEAHEASRPAGEAPAEGRERRFRGLVRREVVPLTNVAVWTVGDSGQYDWLRSLDGHDVEFIVRDHGLPAAEAQPAAGEEGKGDGTK